MTDQTGMMNMGPVPPEAMDQPTSLTLPVLHRGILIQQSEVPGAPFEWLHEETDAHGMAETLQAAKRQINGHLGTADPDCPYCQGHGSEDWTYLAYIDCRMCPAPEAA